MVMEGNLNWGSEHTPQYPDDIPESYIILLISVT